MNEIWINFGLFLYLSPVTCNFTKWTMQIILTVQACPKLNLVKVSRKDKWDRVRYHCAGIMLFESFLLNDKSVKNLLSTVFRYKEFVNVFFKKDKDIFKASKLRYNNLVRPLFKIDKTKLSICVFGTL